MKLQKVIESTEVTLAQEDNKKIVAHNTILTLLKHFNLWASQKRHEEEEVQTKE